MFVPSRVLVAPTKAVKHLVISPYASKRAAKAARPVTIRELLSVFAAPIKGTIVPVGFGPVMLYSISTGTTMNQGYSYNPVEAPVPAGTVPVGAGTPGTAPEGDTGMGIIGTDIEGLGTGTTGTVDSSVGTGTGTLDSSVGTEAGPDETVTGTLGVEMPVGEAVTVK